MAKQTFKPTTAVFTPPEAVNIALEAVKAVKENSFRALPLPMIGEYFAPLLPGELTILQAQTSNYKSGFMHWWERQAAISLMDAGRGDEAIIHVSVEELIETQMFYHLGRETGENSGDLARGVYQDWDKLERAAVKIGSVPIYRVGASLARPEDMPDLYLSNILESILALTSGVVTGSKIRPAAIYLDYLQAFPIDPEVRQAGQTDQRRLQVRQDIYRCRQAAAIFDCPVILAAQSKQKLDGANPPLMIPGVYDIEETSSAAQRADRIISLWLPKTSYTVGSLINAVKNFTVDENLLFVKIAKQRGGLPAGRIYKCRVDYAQNEIRLEAQA